MYVYRFLVEIEPTPLTEVKKRHGRRNSERRTGRECRSADSSGGPVVSLLEAGMC